MSAGSGCWGVWVELNANNFLLPSSGSNLLGIITKKDILLHIKECEDLPAYSGGEHNTSAASVHSGSFFA